MARRAGQLEVLPWDLTSFVGRASERERLCERLAASSSASVVSLFGIAGIGKSRLARVVAASLAGDGELPGGVVWCHGASDIERIAEVIAPAGAAPAVERVAAALVRRDRSLIILDSPGPIGEDVIDGIRSWLSCGAHGFVVAARFAAALRGAMRIEIEPLAPDEAAALLADRCRELGVDADGAAIERLAPLAGGMPLAVELIAAALVGQAPAAIAERIAAGTADLATDDRDVPPRHRSLAAAFADTWRHLDERDREALAIAATFAAPFEERAFASVARELDSDARLDRIVRRGLAAADGERFRVLRGLARLARESLDPGDARRYAAAHAAVMSRANGPDPAELLVAADAGDAEIAPGLARQLINAAYDHRRSSRRLADRALERARALAPAGDNRDAALVASAEHAWLRGDAGRAREWLEAIDGDEVESARRRVDAMLALDRGDLDGARAELGRAIDSASDPLDRARAHAARFGLELACRADVDDEDGLFAYMKFRSAEALREASVTRVNLGLAALNRGDRPRGLAYLSMADDEARECSEGAAIAAVALFRGLDALDNGDFAGAAELIAGAEAVALDVGVATLWSDAVGYGAVARHLAGVASARAELASHVDDSARRGPPAAHALFAAYLARIDDARIAPDPAVAAGRPLVQRAIAVLADGSGDPAGLPGRIARRFVDQLPGVAPASGPVLRVAADRRQFEIGGRAIDLRRRGPLGRIFEALIAADGAVDPEALIEAGWPGEAITPESARTRLYNAVASLRQMGLRGLLVTVDDGYRLEGVTLALD